GAKRVYACATHGLLVEKAVEKLREARVEQIAITDSVPLAREKAEKLPAIKVISVAPLLANAIQRIHGNESVSRLFEDELPAERR
ncbi:MAG TPA: ribose-phosphate diphosphokinase, partial [Gemmataceae bacterium]|nr:ribose-phosphate diphosphokinase [Gemmataceae bacterium]